MMILYTSIYYVQVSGTDSVISILMEFIKGHWGHQKTKMYYNGLKHEDIMRKEGPVFGNIEREPPI